MIFVFRFYVRSFIYKSFTLLLMFHCFLAAAASDTSQSFSLPLYGNINSFKETAYHIVCSDNDAELQAELQWEYSLLAVNNRDGSLRSIEYFKEDGSSAGGINYTYQNGKLSFLEHKRLRSNNPNRETYVWSEKGQLLETERTFSRNKYGWRYRNVYDTENRIIKTIKYDRFWNWKQVYQKQFYYDDLNRLSAVESFGVNSVLLEREEYRYNESGYLEETWVYNSKKEMITIMVHSYDEQNFLIKTELFDSRCRKYASYAYSYEFDAHNNWIKKIKGSDYGGYINPHSLVVREIEYAE